jgi:CheY-like chemotaxis protein
LISLLLEKAGCNVCVVDNGEKAVELAMATDRECLPFDVVIMDMQMPLMDGYDATRQLRAYNYSGAIVALTANAMVGDREKCLNAGCDDYTTKPVRRKELLSVMARHAKRAEVSV